MRVDQRQRGGMDAVAYQGLERPEDLAEGKRTWVGRRHRLPDCASMVGSRVDLAGAVGPLCRLMKLEAVCALTEICEEYLHLRYSTIG